MIPLMVGNWKMNLLQREAVDLVQSLNFRLKEIEGVDIAVVPPMTALPVVVETLSLSPIKVASQNMYFESSGAYTGEVSAPMLKDAGVSYVLIGHSERRQYFFEDDTLLNKKIHAALNHGLIPILCIGETLKEREEGKYHHILGVQLMKGLEGVGSSDIPRLVVAYEPVWAIGTGKTAVPDQVREVHQFLRQLLVQMAGDQGAKVRLLYGGSVNAQNAHELLHLPNVNGALVGGASLKPESFIAIVKSSL